MGRDLTILRLHLSPAIEGSKPTLATYQCLKLGRSELSDTKKPNRAEVEQIVSSSTRLTGEPVRRIFCKKTGNLVGYLYKWNNGDLQPAWLDTAKADVRYEPMIEAA